MEKNIFNYWIVCTMKMEKMRIETDTIIKGLGFKDIKSALLPCFIRRLLPKITNFHTCEFASMYTNGLIFTPWWLLEGIWLVNLLGYLHFFIKNFCRHERQIAMENATCLLSAVCQQPTYSVYRACLISQSIRWRFFYLNGTFYRGITKPFFLL